MTSPPNFLSFAALNTSRLNSPVQSPYLSPFPSSPSSPGLEPRRTKSRHMDTFSFFDAKPQSPGPLRESMTPIQSGIAHEQAIPLQQAQHQPAQPHMQSFSQQPPQLARWDSFGSNPSSPYQSQRVMTPGGSRATMPRQWISQQDPFSNDNTPLASPNLSVLSAGLGTVIGDDGDEVISTAVVVKNIPFSLKKETLLELFDQMTLPKPYAFNYHFDNGTFRGLAFANFHSPEETQHVIRALNGYELIGRKLRVEYKKVLPADQRERIELQKRQKAYQDETFSSVRPKVEKRLDIDLNDPATLQIYSSLLLFRDDVSPSARTQMAFPPEFSMHQRRVVHLIAQKLGLDHSSRGEGEERYIVISKPENGSESPVGQVGPANGTAPSNQQIPSQASSTGPLRIDTKQDGGLKKAYPHLQPPGLKHMKSYDGIRAPSPLRTAAGATSGDDCYSTNGQDGAPFACPVAVYPNPLASPGVGSVVTGLGDLSIGNSSPVRQPKGPEPKTSFLGRKKDSQSYE